MLAAGAGGTAHVFLRRALPGARDASLPASAAWVGLCCPMPPRQPAGKVACAPPPLTAPACLCTHRSCLLVHSLRLPAAGTHRAGTQRACLPVHSPHLPACAHTQNSRTQVAAGARHSVALTDDGRPFAWGFNGFGQLGLGDEEDRCTPCPLDCRAGIATACTAGNSGNGAAAEETVVLQPPCGLEAVGRGAAKDKGAEQTCPRVVGVAAGWWHTLLLVRGGCCGEECAG